MTSLIPPLMGLPGSGEPAGAALGPFVLVKCSGRIAHHSGVVALLNTFKAQGKDFTVVSFPALAMGCSIPRPPPPKHRPPSWNGYKSGSRQGSDRPVGLLSGASGAAERCGDPVDEHDPNVAIIPIRPAPPPGRLGIAWHPERRLPLALLPFVEVATEICRDLGEQWAASRAA
jgi:hypothetical protein